MSHEAVKWRAHWRLEKYLNDEEFAAGNAYEVIDREGNLLVIGGASALWQRLIGTGVTAFDNTNAHLGVGDSTTAAADSQTDLQAASNKLRKAMDATYPQHTDSTSAAGAKSITYRSTYASGDANFAWQEWGLFNASSTGRMLNRKVESLGTKASGSTWTLTVTLSLA
ncbi:hypothetical protein [Saccharopolyspora mangrovi]|uniref:Uncharacterized protein n=1 Tax=Saccharopolyspora mangrovi TaxID=3082379 RepID=A0ABU6A767_9PSEU|nr:hypothetical protein [Saccharopolyspora sp. S2-29]MEB3367403.1 hypothetical protein [Saccharopolyspora sp. S2-29]